MCYYIWCRVYFCCFFCFFFFSSRRRHTRCSGVSWARDVYKRQPLICLNYDVVRGCCIRPKMSMIRPRSRICLLYTSDAADEEDSVDLGGRRIIKKKKKNKPKT